MIETVIKKYFPKKRKMTTAKDSFINEFEHNFKAESNLSLK